jgi:hypothetical protein
MLRILSLSRTNKSVLASIPQYLQHQAAIHTNDREYQQGTHNWVPIQKSYGECPDKEVEQDTLVLVGTGSKEGPVRTVVVTETPDKEPKGKAMVAIRT